MSAIVHGYSGNAAASALAPASFVRELMPTKNSLQRKELFFQVLLEMAQAMLEVSISSIVLSFKVLKPWNNILRKCYIISLSHSKIMIY